MRHLAAPGAVLVFDETGQEKKGGATAGFGRQYTGTTGQVSNAVVAVYCTYASALRHCLIDSDLYVQKHWTKDPQRCERAGLGGDFISMCGTQPCATDQPRAPGRSTKGSSRAPDRACPPFVQEGKLLVTWQTLQLDSGGWGKGQLPALVAWTGAPACTAWRHGPRDRARNRRPSVGSRAPPGRGCRAHGRRSRRHGRHERVVEQSGACRGAAAPHERPSTRSGDEKQLRAEIDRAGFTVLPYTHPYCPIRTRTARAVTGR